MSATSTDGAWARRPSGLFPGAEPLPYWVDEARAGLQGPWLVLAHGAGAGPLHPVQEAFSACFHRLGWNVLRFAFPFRAARPAGRIGRDSPARGQAAVAAAFRVAQGFAGAAPVVLAGHSYGARRTLEWLSSAAPPVAGALLLAYPLAPPKRKTPAPLPDLPLGAPCAFISGDRDALAPPGSLEAALAGQRSARLWRIAGADHGWSRPKTLFAKGGPLTEALRACLGPLGV